MCGVVGIVGRTPVNLAIYDALTVLQHRGQDAAGIITCDGNRLFARKKNGLVRDVFSQNHMLELIGNYGLGHVRYPTAGCSSSLEAQPFYVNSPYGICLAHNGNLTNAAELSEMLVREDRRHLKKIAQLTPGGSEVFAGEITFAGESQTSRSRKKLFEVTVTDGTGQVSLKWFRYRRDWMKKQFIRGRRAVFIGEVKRFGATREVHHPEVEFIADEQDAAEILLNDPLNFGRILPVYPLTEGLAQKNLRKITAERIGVSARCF